MGSADDDLLIDVAAPGCPPGACGFSVGDRALLFDPGGAGLGYELFTVTRAGGVSLGHGPPNRGFSRAYEAGAVVAEVREHSYYLDVSTRRLMHEDGSGVGFPVIDNVVDLSFAYFAEPDPAHLPPPSDPASDCLYWPGDPPLARLTHLGGAAAVVLTPARLTDGPVCGVGERRFDGDLLRVERVRVTIAVQVAPESLRGRDPRSFRVQGLAREARLLVPDYRVSFDVAPRNLALTR
jgi:hypothetical protein